MKHILGENSRSTLTNVVEGDAQPNAVDLRLGKVFRIKPNVFEIDNETKKHRGSEEVQPDAEGWYTLEPGAYEVVMENIIRVGEDEAGWVITRSTLNRNDVFLTSGLYDSSYHGTMAACMHVGTAPMRIKRGTRIGQYLSFDAEMKHQYSGDYGFDENGNPKAMEKKYHQ